VPKWYVVADRLLPRMVTPVAIQGELEKLNVILRRAIDTSDKRIQALEVDVHGLTMASEADKKRVVEVCASVCVSNLCVTFHAGSKLCLREQSSTA